MPDSPKHQWLATDQRVPWAQLAADRGWPELLLPPVNAHRRRRGPYTAAGTIVRALLPSALARVPELVRAHEVELLTVAPELRGVVPSNRETLTSLAVPKERTRYYSPARTLQLAHGLTEFLRDYVAAAGPAPAALVLDLVDQADPTDSELIAVLLRRLDPRLITVVVRTSAALEDGPLATALVRWAEAVPPPVATGARLTAERDRVGPRDLAAAYVASDCTDDDHDLLAAYQRLTAQDRRVLHDARAAELAAAGEFSWQLGAIPYHLERGTSPAQAVRALAEGVDYCTLTGFYPAALDLGLRGRSLVEPATDWPRWWLFTNRTATCMSVLDQTEEAELLYQEAWPLATEPRLRMSIAYHIAMLYTRHHGQDAIDHQRALDWIGQAIALAEQIPEASDRAFSVVFAQNGQALIENHLGRPEEALRLVSAGFARLARDLEPDEQRLHRSVLRHNRAMVYGGLGRLDEAAADFRAVIASDPNYPDPHFDLGNLLRKLGNDEEALVEYETAIRLSPPFPELFYNRADTRAALGDIDGGLADFGYVLDLDPDYVDAHVNRTGLLLELGDAAAARAAAEAGLAVAPRNAHLLCLLGRLELEAGDLDRAAAALDAALLEDPALESAWATHAALAFERGDLDRALTDLVEAVRITPTAALLFNLGAVHEAQGNWADAVTAFSQVTEMEPDDPDGWLRLAACRAQAGDHQAAGASLSHFLTLAPDRRAEATGVLIPDPVHS